MYEINLNQNELEKNLNFFTKATNIEFFKYLEN